MKTFLACVFAGVAVWLVIMAIAQGGGKPVCIQPDLRDCVTTSPSVTVS